MKIEIKLSFLFSIPHNHKNKILFRIINNLQFEGSPICRTFLSWHVSTLQYEIGKQLFSTQRECQAHAELSHVRVLARNRLALECACLNEHSQNISCIVNAQTSTRICRNQLHY